MRQAHDTDARHTESTAVSDLGNIGMGSCLLARGSMEGDHDMFSDPLLAEHLVKQLK